MVERSHILAPQSPLNGLHCQWLGFSVSESPVGEIVSIAAQKNQQRKIEKNFKKEFGSLPPETARLIDAKGARIFWTAPDQWFAIYKVEDSSIDRRLAEHFGDTASITLQSDAWCAIEISGERLSDVTERLLHLDLSEDAFPAGSAARTQIHHFNCLVLRPTNNTLQLLCARSYAQDFADMIMRTATAILGAPNDRR